MCRLGNELAKTEYKKTQFEMAVIKMINEELDTSAEGLLSRIENLEKKIKNGVTVATVPADEPPPIVEEPPKPIEKSKTEKPVEKPKVNMDDAQKYEDWADVIEKLGEFNKAIAAALNGSNMYISGNYALIDTQSTLAIKLIKENADAKASLKRAIAEVTGKNYNIGPYRRSTEQKNEEGGLSKLMQKAQNMDIKIEG